MAHDSYHCENERLKNASAIKVFPFPIQRDGKYTVGGVLRPCGQRLSFVFSHPPFFPGQFLDDSVGGRR